MGKRIRNTNHLFADPAEYHATAQRNENAVVIAEVQKIETRAVPRGMDNR